MVAYSGNVTGNSEIDLYVGPYVKITSLKNGDSFVRGTKVNVEVSASSSLGIAKVELYIDNIRFEPDTSSPYSFVWDTRTYLEEGPLTVHVVAYDTNQKTGEDKINVTLTAQ